MNTQGFEIGNTVLDGDQYEAKIVRFEEQGDEVVAVLDYSEFPADVPAEASEWPLEDLALADEDDELDRRQDNNEWADPNTDF